MNINNNKQTKGNKFTPRSTRMDDRTKVLWKRAYCTKIPKSSILSEEDFQEMASKNCHYCGVPFSLVYKDVRWKKGKEIQITDSEIRLNSLSRIDPNLGYIKENCVPCCSSCLLVKNKMSQQKFSEQVERIYNYFCK